MILLWGPTTALRLYRNRFNNVFSLVSLYSARRYSKNTLTPSGSSQKFQVDTNVKPLSEKVKETTKTTSYFAIILVGLGITGGLVYTVFNELFSGKSPNNIYSKAATRCIEFPQVSDKLGYPISAFGEETRRGRRQHVSHGFYLDKEGHKHIRMKFHLKGTAHSGTAHLDMVETDSGNYEYRFLFVEVDDMFKTVIVIEDNRNKMRSSIQSSDFDLQL
ncbi:mitochondrial import inner membrane translocase subunit Tim21 [Dendroctonus ponderosae]|nr:mitochondrial import inner membrane translocase subunit Tim21 [Dendroctonus ponderosae]AEE62894.1 unknown [Dendroctonus ponderosae]KAH1027931.1 hypothetical protein HUJ05_001351 [Dendroctonus ponderosae]